MENVKKSFDKKKVLNIAVNVAMIVITAIGSFQNGWFTLANLVSWMGLIGTIGIAYKWQGNFWFNATQNIFNVVVSARSKLFGDAIMALYYLGTQIPGFRSWKANRSEDGALVVDKKTDWKVVINAILIGGILLGGVSYALGGAFIILDAFNNSTAIVAQYLQIIKRKRSSWILWGVTNAVGVVIWMGVGVPQMAIMYTVFLLNSARAYVNWSE